MPAKNLKSFSLFALGLLSVMWLLTRSDTAGFAARRIEIPTGTPYTPNLSTLQPTQMPTPILVTGTPTPDLDEGQTVSPASSVQLFFPLLIQQPLTTPMPSSVTRICNYFSASIPDNDPVGVNSQITVDDPRFIQDLDVQVDIDHGSIGDLAVSLTHADTGKSTLLTNRPIDPGTGKRCKLNDIKGILDDEISASVQVQCATSPAAISGIYIPYQPLNIFNQENIAGSWFLNVADNNPDFTGKIKSWCLVAKIGEVIQPTPSPQPPQLPLQAHVSGVTGQNQAMPLDCESRVAVDYAKFFGVHINEYSFFNNLPKSDNPDAGFVGDVYGTWGQIPPHPYGVHADPVAVLLRAYGVVAYAHRPLTWDGLRAEIAAGKPVFVWVIGPADYNEIPVYYTSDDSHMTIVAHYEHVVMVKAYTESSVTIQDGSSTYTRSLGQFLSTWSALQNMAITTQP
jgi:subtilisin-like proprotein convertase family protein